jgi:hypothetical protein
VALGTLSLGNGSVGNIKDDSSIVRSMRVMAGSTVGGCHRVIHVFFCKRWFVGLVTLQTEGRRFPFQQEIGIGRRMRIMAIEATFAFFKRFVLEFNISDISAHIFMAIQTEFIA